MFEQRMVATRGRLLRLWQKYQVVLAVYLTWKVGLVAAMLIANLCSRGVHNDWNQYVVHDKHAWVAPFANWDGQHYLRIAQEGYRPGRPESAAFYPLFPLLTSLIGRVTTDLPSAAFVTTTVFGFLAALLFYAMVERWTSSRAKACVGLVLLLSYPSAFYLTALYAESVALFVILGFFYFYRAKPRWFAMAFAFLLPWAKAQGLFVAGVLLADAGLALVMRRRRRFVRAAANLLAAGAGLASVLGFYRWTTGNAWAPVAAQKHFVFNLSTSNMLSPTHFVEHFLSSSQAWFDYNNGLLDKVFIGAMFLALVLVARGRSWRVTLLYLLLVVPTATMGEGGSFTRHSLLAWPFAVLAILARLRLSKAVAWALAVGSLGVQVYLASRFATNLWVG